MTSQPSSAPMTRGASVAAFVRLVRRFAAAFAVASVIVTIVLAVRTPDCVGIGVSVFGGEDCTNRDAYWLLLAAGFAASIFYTALLFIAAYAIELLGVMAYGATNIDDADHASER